MTRSQASLSIVIIGLGLIALMSTGGVHLDSAPVTPSIFGEAGLNIMICEESEDTDDLPKGQQDILQSTVWKSFWKDKGGAYRKLDPSDSHKNDLRKWQQGAEQLKDLPLPSYGISNGTKWEKGELPKDLSTWTALVEKYGGAVE